MKLKVNNLSGCYDLGVTLLEIRSCLNDSRNLLSNWQASDESPCKWTGITCHPNEQRVRSMYVKPYSLIFDIWLYDIYFQV